MLKRKFESRLQKWLKTKYVLLVDGARQVGKTFWIKDFCTRNFERFIYIDISQHALAPDAFANATTVEAFYLAVSTFSDKKVLPGKTVVFLDEIQKAPKADFRTIAKPLAIDGRCRIIFSGSLLGVTEHNTSLEPTGYMYEERMYPMDFEEFLWANSVQEDVIAKVKECFANRQEVPTFIHEKLLEMFRLYLMIGGLPGAVQAYVETSDLGFAHLSHRTVEIYYKNDVTQYASLEKRPYIRRAYELLPSELNSKSKRFILSRLEKRYVVEKAENDFIWLSDAGVAIPVYNVDEPKIPLDLSRNNTLLKLFANDVGLLCYRLLETGIQEKILAHTQDINFGSIYENAVAQELLCHGYEDKRLCYFSSKKQGEVDFLILYKSEVVPLEIKSGKGYKRHVALDNLLTNPEYGIKEGFVFGDCNLEVVGKRTYFPIYMIDFLYSSAYRY